jgi:hypothetical protein
MKNKEDDMFICQRYMNAVGKSTLNVNLPAAWLRHHRIRKDNCIIRMTGTWKQPELTLRFIKVDESVQSQL